jgi:hypothetical protein
MVKCSPRHIKCQFTSVCKGSMSCPVVLGFALKVLSPPLCIDTVRYGCSDDRDILFLSLSLSAFALLCYGRVASWQLPIICRALVIQQISVAHLL